jgi:hypothetical protein
MSHATVATPSAMRSVALVGHDGTRLSWVPTVCTERLQFGRLRLSLEWQVLRMLSHDVGTLLSHSGGHDGNEGYPSR